MNDLDDLVVQLARETRSFLEERLSGLEAKRAIEFAEFKAQISELIRREVKDALAGQPKPLDGKSVTVDDVRPLIDDAVRREVSAQPKPAGGAPGRDGQDGINGKDGKDGSPGIPGKDAEVDYDRIGNVIAVAVDKAIANAPKPKDGADGQPGKDAAVDYALLREFVDAAVTNALAAIPKPKDGEPGPRGERGEPGAPGERGERGEKGEPGQNGRDVDDEVVVQRVLALVPAPKDGANGKDGERGPQGERGEAGAHGELGEKGESGLNGRDGAPGASGRDGASAFEVARAHGFVGDAIEWLASLRGKDGTHGRDADESAIVQRLLTLIPKPENGRDGKDGINGKDAEIDHAELAELVQRQVKDAVGEIPTPRDGRDGAPGVAGMPGEPGENGRDGRDGWSPEDLELELRDARMLIVRLRKGQRVVERTLKLALPLDRGVYVKGRRYEQGDVVTYGGSAYIAQRDTDAPIGGDPPSPDWRLIVKRGRDA